MNKYKHREELTEYQEILLRLDDLYAKLERVLTCMRSLEDGRKDPEPTGCEEWK